METKSSLVLFTMNKRQRRVIVGNQDVGGYVVCPLRSKSLKLQSNDSSRQRPSKEWTELVKTLNSRKVTINKSYSSGVFQI